LGAHPFDVCTGGNSLPFTNEPKERIMSQGIPIIVYPVSDTAAAKKLFGAFLGVEPYVDSPYYIGYKIGDQEVGLDPHGQSVGPIAYREVSDIQASLQALMDAGAKTVRGVTNVGGGLLIATVQDANGSVIGLRQQP
jgi:predicted enzyme related to lactoylglutathione lyase